MKKILLVMLFGVFISGCVTTGKYRVKVNEAAEYKAQTVELNDKINQLTDEKSKLEMDKAGLEKQLASLQADNKNLSDTLTSSTGKKNQLILELTQSKQALEQQIASITAEKATLQKEKDDAIAGLKSTYDNLVNNLQTEIKQGEIQITQLEGKLTVNMVDKILFDSGKAEVNSKGRKTLDSIGAILKNITDKQIRIEGHTDNVPISKELQATYPSNWELSAARASHVARYLIGNVGVNPKFVSISGYADTMPVDTNDTPEGRAKNRRIEIILLPSDTQVKK